MSTRRGSELRIHFTRDDLMRIRLADAPDPMWEIVNSLNLLQHGDGRLVFGAWRRDVLTGRPGDARTAPRLRALTALAPHASYIPDFLTPATVCRDLDSGIAAVLDTPVTRLAADLDTLASRSAPPPDADLLARGDPRVLRGLGEALRGYHRTALERYWPSIQECVAADLEVRTRALLRGGAQELLHSLRPRMCWDPPVLRMAYPVDRDLHLRGRGLWLVPSFFCWRVPVALADPALQPVVAYPVERPLGWADGAEGRGAAADRLAPLLGPTRARILEIVARRGCSTTTDLARAAVVSAPAVSKHTSVLREAGLIASRREGKNTLHSATPVGLALLHRGQCPSSR
ncbi:ArsR/SmtB family transcription factor [Actinorugispora endophytica]|uniref:DNA-binding transcriptional ArsR family regulator n=1 Tax=Actinorugispora endophytica TaxID=1605990 RepID=A0A4R6V101_9ACTN|nr:helix-turn-helix domain-containing protein [Actinorugispora endophytica]TDQ53482.1 DNA-binding transcriptional ArsR family regulator [Actinorugispora endophytica]